MAIVAKFAITGMTAEKYEAALKRLDAAGQGAPVGRLHHVSYGSHDNLQVIDIFDSPQALENFGKTLGPIMQEMGVKAEPQIEAAYKIIKG